MRRDSKELAGLSSPSYERLAAYKLQTLTALFWEFQRVSRLVILDLESQKIMNRPNSGRVFSGDTDFRTAGRVLDQVGDFHLELFHGLCTWRYPLVDKPRN